MRSKGAKILESHWRKLSGEKALQWNRELNYPEWSKSGLVTFILPEFPPHKDFGRGAVMGQLKPGPGIYQEMLELPYPSDLDAQNRYHEMPDPDKLDWNLIRKGERTRIDIAEEGFPELEAGDLVEVVGVPWKGLSLIINNTRSLGDFRETQLRNAILHKISVPFTLKLGETEHQLEMRGDCFAYDPRTKIVPYFETIDQLLLMIGTKWRGDGDIPQTIKIRHQEMADFQVPFKAADRIQVHPGDLIEVSETSNRPSATANSEYPLDEAKRDRRTNYVSVEVPGLLSGWHWLIEPSISTPTLLQAITEINRGLEHKEGCQHPVLPSGSDSPLATAPGLDLSKIRVLRLNEDETEEILEIDLAAEVRKWEESGRKEEPYDLELAAGDIVELVLQEGDWAGYSESQNQYLQEALSLTVGIQAEDGTVRLVRLNYEAPQWEKTGEVFLPVAGLGTVEWRHNLLPPLHNANVIRDGQTASAVSRWGVAYFPREGDILTEGEKNIIVPQAAPGQTRSKPSSRTRFVPRPKE